MIQKKKLSPSATQNADATFKIDRAPRPARRDVRRGQAMVEMALVITILLFLTLGLIQYGLIANAKVTLTNLAREGARYAAVKHGDTVFNSSGTTTGSLRWQVHQVANNTTLKDISDSDITWSTPTGSLTTNDLITVNVSYDLRKKLILPSGFPGLSNIGTTKVSAVMRME